MECVLCGKNTGITRRKINNGYICGNCARQIPDFLRSDLAEYSDLRLKLINFYLSENNKKKFEKTASYGNLIIDELNGLFCIKTANGSYTLDPVDMTEGDIICTNPRVNSNNVVYVDVEFSYKMESPNIKIRTKIKKKVKCQSKKITERTLEWSEPSDLIMFRNMFNQMLKKITKRFSDMINRQLITKADIEYLKAKALFMVDDDYTAKEIKNTRKKLMKVYHPDNGEANHEKAEKINRYYDMLLERREN